MELPSPRAFELDRLADHSSVDALRKLHDAFSAKILSSVDQASAEQLHLVAQMRHVDGCCAATSAVVQKLSKSKPEPLSARLHELAEAITSTRKQIEQAVGGLEEIDAMLPPGERLLAPNLPHRAHYKMLHQLMKGSSFAATDQGLQAPSPNSSEADSQSP